jgi:E3 ubiquitin-protein ligase RHF
MQHSFLNKYRYRESIRKNTRGWKERLFSRNVTLSDLGSEVKKEVSNGIASVSRMMQRLETKGNSYVHEVRGNNNNLDGSSNINPNQSMRLQIARVAASDGSSSSPFPSIASSSNACVASSSSK